MKSIGIVVLVAAATSGLVAGGQSQSVVIVRGSAPSELTGNFQVDFFGQKELATLPLQDQTELLSEVHRKSPWLASGLSIVLPGAGEFYAENYWKAALFLAIDVAAWGLAYSLDKKGDNQTEFFQGFANQHYSVVKYAEFSRDNFTQFIPENRRTVMQTQLVQGSPNQPPWQRVNWTLLNELERYISASGPGKYYSHTLPLYGEQQYFELIGKYPQFTPGWDDAVLPYVYSEDNATPNFKYYSIERGKANDFYSKATTFVTVAIVNHVLSALDAAWTASNFNRSLHASVRMQTIPTGFGYARVPVARLEYSF